MRKIQIRNQGRHCSVAALAAGIAALFASTVPALPPITPSSRTELLDHVIEQSNECIAAGRTAFEKIADNELQDAKGALQDCVTALDNTKTSINSAKNAGWISATDAAGLLMQVDLYRFDITNPTLKNGALDEIDAVLKSDPAVNTDPAGIKPRSKSELVGRLASAQARGENTQRNAGLRLDRPNPPRLMLAATGPSLHTPNSRVCWRVLGLAVADRKKDAASCPISVQGVNPAGGLSGGSGGNLKSIAGGPDSDAPFTVPLVAPGTNPCSGQICFMLQGDMGGGDIRILYDNDGPGGTDPVKVAERILFNRGNGRPDPMTGLPTIGMLSGVAQFAGAYSGGWQGTFTYTGSEGNCGEPPGTQESFSGGAAFEVSTTGKMTVSDPGPGTGTVTGLGGSTTGSVSAAGGTSRFIGGIMTNRLNSVATARGTWTFSNSCGKATGTWLATR